MKTCLIVIDVQESFRHRPYFTHTNVPAYLQAQNALINGCIAQGLPIVRVLHTDGPSSADNPFAQASGHVRPMEGLAPFTAAATCPRASSMALRAARPYSWRLDALPKRSPNHGNIASRTAGSRGVVAL